VNKGQFDYVARHTNLPEDGTQGGFARVLTILCMHVNQRTCGAESQCPLDQPHPRNRLYFTATFANRR
jgi:hypothetical protein